jgi:hypothetical protein
MPAIRAMHSLSVLDDEVRRSRQGQFFFAHVLIPHNPYIYDSGCKERDVAAWEDNHDRDSALAANTAATRVLRYELYFQQIACAYAKLQEMFDDWRRAGVFDGMKIIIQGDHGSRIYMTGPTVANKDQLVPSDYVDAFSTLFAVKAPGLQPAYDTRMVAIQDQLEAVAHGQLLEQFPASDTQPYVLLENGVDMIRQAMPEFGDPSREEHRIHLSRP